MESNKLPGWRIEQKFNTNVLIGNWNEERRKFERGNITFGNSTHRHDFKNYGSYVPDMKVRREASMRNDGLPKELIFSHHGKSYSNNMISWYDGLINKREIKESSLPKLRSWDSKRTAWVPERTDHPLLGRPTVFGLRDRLSAKWQKELEQESKSTFESTYTSSFEEHPKDALVFQHYATKIPLSSHFNSHNVNKNLPLRNTQVNLAPEFPPTIPQKVSQ